MIYAELAGGLGNQMFIYAFARALGLRCNEPVTLLDRQDWKDGAPAHTVCALNDLSISPDVQILADPGFAKAHLPRQNTAKALMIKYEQRRGLMARDWQPFENRCAPALNALGLHFATDGYTPVHRGCARDFLAWGYFQSARYFNDFSDEIKAELRPKAAPRRGAGRRHRGRRLPGSRPPAPGRLLPPRERDFAGMHPRLLRPRRSCRKSCPPRCNIIRVFGRCGLGKAKPEHRRLARRFCPPGQRGGGIWP